MDHQNIRHTWTIPNFDLFNRGDKLSMQSSPFPGSSGIEFVLKMNPPEFESYEYISLALYLVKPMYTNIFARCTFSIRDINGNPINVSYSNNSSLFFLSDHWKSEKFIIKDDLSEQRDFYLPYDRLAILCVIDIFKKTSSECLLKDQICNIFNDRDFTDVVFTVGKEEVRAHKVILATRSPVFSDLLKKANNENIEIKGIELNVFKEMLYFIYSEECPNLPCMSRDILEVSNLYMLDDLKHLAEKELAKTINIENVVELLCLADRHSARNLDKSVRDFVCLENFVEISRTDGWDSLIRIHPRLLSGVLALSGISEPAS